MPNAAKASVAGTAGREEEPQALAAHRVARDAGRLCSERARQPACCAGSCLAWLCPVASLSVACFLALGRGLLRGGAGRDEHRHHELRVALQDGERVRGGGLDLRDVRGDVGEQRRAEARDGVPAGGGVSMRGKGVSGRQSLQYCSSQVVH